MLLRESVKINNSILMKKKKSLVEDRRKDQVQRAHTHQNPKETPHWRVGC